MDAIENNGINNNVINSYSPPMLKNLTAKQQ
ncbi:hypothetical protein J2T04_000081 [Chryseobacterium lathyri]|uniref:Uncharacterized protein n=1 Tax=Chryseobacterium lathyri TaxID=395933 RepID=A0ABT9SFL9_9FLAO|nr:hypothetical protein [Chryseobacterium lathyri]MDQ0066238.1 hypothetical protein [Chryseobacterium lathyri]